VIDGTSQTTLPDDATAAQIKERMTTSPRDYPSDLLLKMAKDCAHHAGRSQVTQADVSLAQLLICKIAPSPFNIKRKDGSSMQKEMKEFKVFVDLSGFNETRSKLTFSLFL